MQCKLKELERLCKRYRRKKWLPFALIGIAFAGVALFSLQRVVDNHMHKQVKSHPESQSRKTQNVITNTTPTQKNKNIGDLKYCYSLQFLYTFDRYRDELKRKEREIEALGFDCRQKFGEQTAKGRKVFLVCNTVNKKKTLQQLKKLANIYGLEYQVIRDSCNYVKDYTLVIPNNNQHRTTKIKKDLSTRDQHKRDLLKSEKKKRVARVVHSEIFDPEKIQNLFKNHPRYTLAIKLAKHYYNKKMYKKALQWAKEANRLDRDNEEAWIYYAKSLYALGKREEAKNILHIFLEYKESQKAKKLLKKWG